MQSIAKLVFLSAWVSLTSAFNPPESAAAIRTTETCGNIADVLPFYRTYDSAVIDHWYTPDVSGINIWNPRGYALEGVAGLVFLTQEEGTAPLYYLYSQAATDSFYTMSTTERDAALKNGYGNRSSTYIYPTQSCGSIPLYRLFSASGKDNFYTTSESERLDFIANRGYVDMEVAGYILPVDSSQCA
ncbi:hypothetical protein DFH09DRAFT_1080133 [Mycena vulgaris]|nr:hypothetical protein DFH09DRAFT_1080133 [Mycena vulgaris]